MKENDYTEYKYSNLRINKTHFLKDEILEVSVDVKNIGNKLGKESVLLYSSDLIASMTPDGRRLRDLVSAREYAGGTLE